MNLLHQEITDKILRAFYNVYNVYYRNEKVGQYFADIIVNDCVILELKATETICEEHECQLINYLKATNIEVGLLLNFGKKPSYKRKIFTNKKF
jgi:GxxExxY protein